MYNYQQYQRQQKVITQCKGEYEDFLKDIQSRKSKNNAMHHNYKKRVDAFMVHSIESPVEVNQYVHPKYEPRSFLSNQKLDRSFRMKYHTTQQRLHEILQKNQVFDSVPFHNTSSHRFREIKSNHSEKSFKYRPSCTASRLYDSLSQAKTNQIQAFNKLNTKQILKVSKNHLFNAEKQENIKLICKSLAPELHTKTYFNSLRSMLVQQYPNSILQKECENSDRQQHDQKDKKNIKLKIHAHQQANRRQNVIEALIKSGLMKQKIERQTFRA